LRGEIPLLELLFMVGGVRGEAKRMTVIRLNQPSVDANPSMPLAVPEGGSLSSMATPLEVNLIALLSRGDLSQNILIKPGDTIYVSSGTGERYYVLGQVKRPGPYEWIEDITVLEAIKLAEGVTERGAPNRIKVRKTFGGRQEEIKINLTDIMKGKKKDDVVIKPNDVIIVPESWI
jgi:polysaccharide export outer membrane protein